MNKAFPIYILITILVSCAPTSLKKLVKKANKETDKEIVEKYCSQILQMDSSNTLAYNRLGEINLYDDFSSSKKHFLKSLSIDSNQANILYLIGQLHLNNSGAMNSNDTILSNELDTAIHWFSKAIDIDSTSGLYYYQRAYAYHYHYYSEQKKDNHKNDLIKSCNLGWSTSCEILNKIYPTSRKIKE